MNAIIFFINIGPYHLARINAANKFLSERKINLIPIQLTSDTREHPWGLKICKPIDTPTILSLNPNFKKLRLPTANTNSFSRSYLSLLLSALKPNILIIPGWSFSVCRFLLFWGNRHNIPLILMSESKEDDTSRNPIAEYGKRSLLVPRFSSALVGCAEHASYLSKLGMPKSKIFTGYNCVDNHYFDSLTSYIKSSSKSCDQFKRPVDSPYFMYVGRFIERKNILRLLEAYQEYVSCFGTKAIKLCLSGSGPLESTLLDFVISNNLQNFVILTGFLSYTEICRWYAHSEALIHPALSEQWGLVLNEACASSLPILASKTVGAAQYLSIDRYNGYKFNPFDVNSIHQALQQFHRLSPTEKFQMQKASRLLVERFSPDHFGIGLLQAIDSAFAGF